MGEAADPGPDSKPRSHGLSTVMRMPRPQTEDEQPLSHKLHVDVEPVVSPAPSPPIEVIRVGGRFARPPTRVVLVPEDSQGTPRSVQDREVPLSFPTSRERSGLGRDGMEEFDLTRLEPTSDEEFPSQVAGPTQWESGADFLVGSRGAGLMPSVSLPTSGSRFHCLAVEDSEFDTKSVPGINRRTGRRLSLIWRADGHPVESGGRPRFW